jgi:hypothetical protein
LRRKMEAEPGDGLERARRDMIAEIQQEQRQSERRERQRLTRQRRAERRRLTAAQPGAPT